VALSGEGGMEGGRYIEISDDRTMTYFRGKMTGKVENDFAKFNSKVRN